jgi:hypothetical protein
MSTQEQNKNVVRSTSAPSTGGALEALRDLSARQLGISIE